MAETRVGESQPRVSPVWMMVVAPLSTVILTLSAASQVQLFAELVCRVHGYPPPDYPRGTFDFSLTAPGAVPTVKECASDPAVQAATARLIAALTATAGLLTFLTVAWWGSFSDRHGRTRVLAIAASGHLVTTLNVIFVANYVERIPGGYWFLLLDSVIAGALGGMASEQAAVFAYMGDLATSENRSRIFSLVSGFSLVGIAVGPLLGSLIVRLSKNIMWVFYAACALRIIQTSLFAFVIPESLTKAQLDAAKARKREEDESLRTEERTALSRLRRMFFFLAPLAVLWPAEVSKDAPNAVAKRDWNLPILALAYGLMLLAMSSLQSQFLYALITFRWDAEYLGYCISSLGTSRGVFLIIILPLAIKYFKNRPAKKIPTVTDASDSEPLLADETAQWPPVPNTIAHSSTFDLALARISIVLETSTFAILPFAPTGIVFMLFTGLGALGSGLAPAVNSVALALYTAKVAPGQILETGKLFGAMSVLQAMFGNVLGPSMYGSIYAATVSTFPTALFFVAVGNGVLAFVLFLFIRLPPTSRPVGNPDVEDLVDTSE